MAEAVTAMTYDPLRKFKYRVTIASEDSQFKFNNLGFNRVGGLTSEYEKAEYREGGFRLGRRKLPGLLKHEDVTLQRGVFVGDIDLWNAFMQIADGNANFRLTITITLQDPITGDDIRTWYLKRAWVLKHEQEDLDALSSEVLIERITVTYEEKEATLE